MSVLYLTTAEVAGLFDVHTSTAKRWCDNGDLPSERTEGGHRRIRMERVLELASERKTSTFLDVYHPYQANVWRAFSKAERDEDFEGVIELAIGWLLHSTPDRIAQLFIDLINRDGMSVDSVLDDAVRGFMMRVGSLWAQGQLRTGDEHVASTLVLESLVRSRLEPADRLLRRDAHPLPTAIVGSAETNDHHLGAATVCLLLERRGWNVIDLGANVPTEDVSALQRVRRADLVCLSFSELAAASEATRTIERLAATYSADSPFALAVGGHVPAPSALPAGPFSSLSSFHGMRDFAQWLPKVEETVRERRA